MKAFKYLSPESVEAAISFFPHVWIAAKSIDVFLEEFY